MVDIDAQLVLPTLKRAADDEDLQKRIAKKPKHDETQIQTDSPTETLEATTRDIISREILWRTRKSQLQVPGKNFAKSVFAVLESVKIKEAALPQPPQPPQPQKPPKPTPDDQNSQPQPQPPKPARGQNMHLQLPKRPLPYNRYRQERYRHTDETGGFNIDPSASFTVAAVAAAPLAVVARPQKVSRTPIIVIPAAPTSVINMVNVKDILEDFRFVDAEEKKRSGFKRDGEVLVQRPRDGRAVPYRIVDNTAKLVKEEWERVVAVFVQGPAWQFKGWPWGGPVNIFAKVKAFHLKFDEMNLEPNVAKWDVQVIQLSRSKRHTDRAKITDFWNSLDKHVVKNKAHLRF